jgi:hypothetical protein
VKATYSLALSSITALVNTAVDQFELLETGLEGLVDLEIVHSSAKLAIGAKSTNVNLNFTN